MRKSFYKQSRNQGIHEFMVSFLLGFLILFSASISAQVPVTNNTMLILWSDSFDRAQFGNRQGCYLQSHYVLKYPQFRISPRDHSRSGGSNLEMLTNRFPMFGIPEWGAAHGLTNVIDFIYVSGNGAPASNTVYGYFQQMFQAPTNAFNRQGLLTNDWTQSNARSLYYKVAIGDVAYDSETGDPTSRDRSYGARGAAIENGVPFVDSWSNLAAVVTNAFVNGPNLWFNAPNLDHPGNELHLIWALTTLLSLGEDTNIYTAVLDFNGASVSSTNHCTVSGVSKSGNTLSFTFHADRFAPAFDVPDGAITNDCRGAFTLRPSLGNAFCEILRLTNLPAGNYTITLDGSNAVTTSSAQLSAGFNWFTNYTGAFWAQKKELLGLLRDMRDISRANASVDAHVGDNRLLEKYESYASSVWPTNNTGVDGYIAQSDMLARETELQAEDDLIHTAALQTNHTFSILQLPSVLAPAHR